MKIKIRKLLLLILPPVILSVMMADQIQAGQRRRPNIVFIAVDDLRPQLGCYGEDYMRTPHLDGLASRAVLFNRHYVQVPTCGASRFALLTSQRPSVAGRWNNGAFGKLKRERTPQAQTFPEFFRGHGYRTVCIGKISHNPDGHVFAYSGKGSGNVEVPHAWDEVGAPHGKWKSGWNAFFGYANGLNRQNWPGKSPVESADVPDDGYPDGLIADAAVKKLAQLSKQDRPFLLAVGFYKPHLPFVAPKKYWDLYDRDKIPLPPNPGKPGDINPNSWHNSNECLGARYNSQKWPRNEKTARLLRHGYFAAVSYADAQIGKVLEAIERLKLSEDTIVIVWGDHGWHLGDHGIWGKHTNFERSARSALIIRAPRIQQKGRKEDALVETVDLYPTLVDLCGLKSAKKLADVSLRNVLAQPKHPGKTAAFTYWRGGTSMRTDRFRLVLYDKGKPKIELYDHRTDANETRNIAAQQPKIVEQLLPQLRANAPVLRSVQSGKR